MKHMKERVWFENKSDYIVNAIYCEECGEKMYEMNIKYNTNFAIYRKKIMVPRAVVGNHGSFYYAMISGCFYYIIYSEFLPYKHA